MVQIDEKGNREDSRHSPRRLKKMRFDGTGDQPPDRKRSKTRRPIEKAARPDPRYIKPTSHRYIAE
jgi:hypothetical protein